MAVGCGVGEKAKAPAVGLGLLRKLFEEELSQAWTPAHRVDVDPQRGRLHAGGAEFGANWVLESHNFENRVSISP